MASTRGARHLGWFLALLAATPRQAQAQAQASAPAKAAAAAERPADVALGCVTHGDPAAPCGAATQGVLRLLWELGRRTSVDVAALPYAVDWEAGPPAEPLVVWTGAASRQLTPRAATHVTAFLRAGGSLLVDVDGAGAGAGAAETFVTALQRQLGQLLAPQRFVAVPPTHVLYKTFYLARAPVGRSDGQAPVLGLSLGGRLAVVVLRHDLLGALGEAAAPEQDLRWAINWVFLALCGDYKDDHVHLPFILRRRQ